MHVNVSSVTALPPGRKIRQHLDASVQAEGRTRDDRLEVLEAAGTASVVSGAKLLERLEILETTAEKWLASLMVRSVGCRNSPVGFERRLWWARASPIPAIAHPAVVRLSVTPM